MKKISVLIMAILLSTLFSGCIEKEEEHFFDSSDYYQILGEDLGLKEIVDSPGSYTKYEEEGYLLITHKVFVSRMMGPIPFCLGLYDERASAMHKWIIQKKKEGKLIVIGWCDPLQRETQSITLDDFLNKVEENGEIYFDLDIYNNKEKEVVQYVLSYIVPDEVYWEYTITGAMSYGPWTPKEVFFYYDPKDINNTNSTGDSDE